MARRNNEMSWTKYYSVWSLALILLVGGLPIDAAKSKKPPSRSGGVSSGRVSRPSQTQQNYNPASLSYNPGDRSHIPAPQQSRPLQSAPAATAPQPAAPLPYPAQPAHPPPYSAHPAPSAPEIPKANPPAAGWHVGEQRQSINTVQSAPPAYQNHAPVNHGPPPPYAPAPAPAYNPHGPPPAYPGLFTHTIFIS